ncbi:hypothetical protein [Acinetobacter sp. ANC 3791]|uniref:hypothetical protein n=1 Tax=Acinetobacter sp. ANC 3791 TaxID=2529836 RepID=UPI0010389BD6|nr:hypothetical protein [Acinetobacter sp. ANC 3791]TCB83652.1 hypothetical protein E0H90_10975 [Acinetobacter sp. ANC 3791]
MQKDVMDLDAQFWERIETLIGDERPYPWAERVGINRSAFQSSRSRGKKPLPKTVRIWAEKIGCSYDWLNNGVGKPFSNDTSLKKVETLSSDNPPILDTSLLQQAFETLDQALSTTNKVMAPEGRSKFVATVYASLKEQESLNTEVLEDCIYTIEEALKSTRRVMSPKAKTDLILVIYDLYSGEASYKEAMKSTINQLIRSVS